MGSRADRTLKEGIRRSQRLAQLSGRSYNDDDDGGLEAYLRGHEGEPVDEDDEDDEDAAIAAADVDGQENFSSAAIVSSEEMDGVQATG